MINLDEVRPLEFSVDKVDVGGSTVALDATTLAALETITVASVTAAVTIQDGGNVISIDDAGGSITIDGTVELGATTLAALESITVVATNLDIRDLAFATDKVDVGGSVVALDAPTLAALESITVQNGAGAAAVNIQDGGNSITVDGTVELGATSLAALETITVNEAAYSSWKSTAEAVTSTAGQIVAVPLTGRLNITIQNLGANDVYIGASNAVTAATGTKIAKYSSFSEKLGASATIWAITASGAADLRVSEFAP
jgi:hypothetical protein